MNDRANGARRVLRAMLKPSNLALAFVGALIWLSLLAFPDEPRTNLDSAWQQALIYASRHSLQAGVDYVCNHGPLGRCMNAIVSWPGGFFTMPYEPHVFYRQVAWEIVINAFLAVVLMLVLARMTGWIARICLAALVMIVLPISKDALYLFALAALTVLVAGHYRGRYVATAIALAFFAVTALMKFSLAIMAAICAVAVAAALLKRSKAAALAAVACYAALVALFWVLAGQSLHNFPAYVKASVALASGHNEAMASHGPFAQVLAGAGMLLAAAILAALTQSAEAFDFARLAAAAALAAAFFMAWKEGFVRHDLHAFIFFAFATPALFLVPRPASGRLVRTAFAAVLCAAVVTGVAGVFASGTLMGFNYSPEKALVMWRGRLIGNAHTLLWPRETRVLRNRQWRAIAKREAMPEIVRAVGSAPVDVFSYGQQRVLLNGLNWRGRPVFQSYLAYTSDLLAANARFFKGQRAPEFVLYAMQPIDRRYPTLEDNRAFDALLRGYTPIMREYGYLLFKRNAAPPAPPAAPAPLLSRAALINHWVSIESSDAGAQVLALDIRYSTLGKARTFLYKAPLVMMRVLTAGGKNFTFRMVPGMAKDGFIINPFLAGDKIADWYLGRPLDRIAAIRIGVDPAHLKYFRPTYALTLRGLAFELPALSNEARAALRRPAR